MAARPQTPMPSASRWKMVAAGSALVRGRSGGCTWWWGCPRLQRLGAAAALAALARLLGCRGARFRRDCSKVQGCCLLTALLSVQVDPKFLRNQRKAKRKQDALKKSGVITKLARFVPKAPQL